MWCSDQAITKAEWVEMMRNRTRPLTDDPIKRRTFRKPDTESSSVVERVLDRIDATRVA